MAAGLVNRCLPSDLPIATVWFNEYATVTGRPVQGLNCHPTGQPVRRNWVHTPFLLNTAVTVTHRSL